RAERGELCFGTIDSWLIWNLTGGRAHVTDVSNASRTLVFDIHRGTWDDELLAALDIPRAMLPKPVRSSGVVADCDASHFGAAIPIAGIAGDQQAALFGQTCFSPGQAKNTYGTGCFFLENTGVRAAPPPKGLLTTIAWDVGAGLRYALEGSAFITGAAVQWLRDGLGLIKSAEETDAIARSIKTNDNVYFVPAFTGLGAPYWDPRARGVLIGLERGTTRARVGYLGIRSGKSDTSPSRPSAAKRVISAGSFTVQACTFMPAECASRRSGSVTNARFGCSAQSAVRRDSWISPASGGD